MASFAKRALETDSDSQEGNGDVEPNTSKRSCLKPSHASHKPCDDVSGEHSPASSAGEPSPASELECSDKIFVNLMEDSDSDEDEQNVRIPAIDSHYSCSKLINSPTLMMHLGMKRFLVDHEYIVCPYCLINDEGKREKPTKVSKIINAYIAMKDKRYTKMLEAIQSIDNILNIDSSEYEQVKVATTIFNSGYHFQDICVSTFIGRLHYVLKKLAKKQDSEDDYRCLFSNFLDIVCSELRDLDKSPKPTAQTNTVSFPNWNQSTTISGKPDIVIQRQQMSGVYTTLVIVQCKKYKEMKFMFKDEVVKDDDDLQKVLPQIRFCKTTKKSRTGDKVAKKEYILERMYKDLDPSICRSLKREEKSYFSCFIGQVVGEVLAWFNTSSEAPVIIPYKIAQDRCIKYAVGQLGFKIIFVTVGINTSCKENPPHIRIGERTGMGLDVFITRPFDLLKVDDRGKIRDILFVMLASNWIGLNECN